MSQMIIVDLLFVKLQLKNASEYFFLIPILFEIYISLQ